MAVPIARQAVVTFTAESLPGITGVISSLSLGVCGRELMRVFASPARSTLKGCSDAWMQLTGALQVPRGF